MSKDSYWYDKARERRDRVRELAPHLLSGAIEAAINGLSDQNADQRTAFWNKLHSSINNIAKEAPDPNCKSAADNLAFICYKLAQLADGHP